MPCNKTQQNVTPEAPVAEVDEAEDDFAFYGLDGIDFFANLDDAQQQAVAVEPAPYRSIVADWDAEPG